MEIPLSIGGWIRSKSSYENQAVVRVKDGLGRSPLLREETNRNHEEVSLNFKKVKIVSPQVIIDLLGRRSELDLAFLGSLLRI